MFGRKDEEMENTEETTGTSPRATVADAPRAMPTPMSGRPATRRAPSPERDRSMGASEERKLTVGKGLSLAGEIAACDVLVVEGKVEAKLADGKLIEITESGQFRGSVEIENADIAGRFDGDLTVHGRLTIRGTGRITGIIKYGELEVNAGGQIIGEMQVVGGGAGAAKKPNFKNAAKFTAAQESLNDVNEVEEDPALFDKKPRKKKAS